MAHPGQRRRYVHVSAQDGHFARPSTLGHQPAWVQVEVEVEVDVDVVKLLQEKGVYVE